MPEFQISPQRQYIIDSFVSKLPDLRRRAGLTADMVALPGMVIPRASATV